MNSNRNSSSISNILYESRIWIRIFIYSLILYTLGLTLAYVLNKKIDIEVANDVTSLVAIHLIGSALILASLCHFFPFFERFFMYRKHLGLTGFFYALFHSVTSILIYGATRFVTPDYFLSYFVGVVAMIIFTVMALISNTRSITNLTENHWRKLMHIGFIGFFLIMVHVCLSFFLKWQKGVLTKEVTIFQFLSFIIVLFVLTMRGAMENDLRRKKA